MDPTRTGQQPRKLRQVVSRRSLRTTAMARPLTNAPPAPRKEYLGPQKFTTAKLPRNPAVDYERGGSDYRCPVVFTSSFGRQVTSLSRTLPRVKFARGGRFLAEQRRSPGPVYGAPSSLSRQVVSKRASAPAHGFGTSNRDMALKMYAVYTV